MTSEVNPAILRQLLRYDPKTGKLFWLERPREFFPTNRAHSIWNARYAGKEALTYSVRGYLYGRLFDGSVSAHRVAFAIFHGEWPVFVDHINGRRSDNRIQNLRSVSRTENNRNVRLKKTNTSGRVGVSWDKVNHCWTAKIGNNGLSIHLGNFSDIASAIKARATAEHQYGYHPNHGRAA